MPYETVPSVYLALQRLNIPREWKFRKQPQLSFLKKVKRRWTSQRLRKHIPSCWCFFSVFSYFVPPPRRCVNGADASLCAGRWRDCFPSLMKGGCWGLIPGYLGHWYALEASAGIVWCQRKGQTQRLGGGCLDTLPFTRYGQSGS